MITSRLYYYDNAKFFLMLSVILGHLLQNNGLHESVSVGLFDTIFMFAMPSFVFLSGIFTPPPHIFKTRFCLSILGLLEPLLIFTFILSIPTLLKFGFSISLLRPGYTLWYLLALIWWRFMVLLIPARIRVTSYLRMIVLVLAILISIVSGFIPQGRGNGLAIPRTLFFLPFFWGGYCLSDKKETCMRFVKRIPAIISITVIFAILVMNSLLSYNQLPFNTGNVPYELWNMNIVEAIVWRIVYSILSIVISICFLSLMPSQKTIVSYYGSKTLLLYVYHALVLYLIMMFFNHFNWPVSFCMAIVEFLVVVPLLMLISRMESARIITAPISNVIKKNKQIR